MYIYTSNRPNRWKTSSSITWFYWHSTQSRDTQNGWHRSFLRSDTLLPYNVYILLYSAGSKALKWDESMCPPVACIASSIYFFSFYFLRIIPRRSSQPWSTKPSPTASFSSCVCVGCAWKGEETILRVSCSIFFHSPPFSLGHETLVDYSLGLAFSSQRFVFLSFLFWRRPAEPKTVTTVRDPRERKNQNDVAIKIKTERKGIPNKRKKENRMTRQRKKK